MKSTKTVLAVAILIAGFSYAVGAGHPQFDSLKHPHRCCGPHPEDLRVYRVAFTNGEEQFTIIPTVEGPNGFVITHVRGSTGVKLYQDVGDGPEEILDVAFGNNALNPTMQFPLVTGSTITALGSSGQNATIIGYVY
ncbi:MAG: hypothetical protein O7D91_09440 [Planctomycetota bacterium]|nr:hypothetical protein [Planctomycetota bacterium]